MWGISYNKFSNSENYNLILGLDCMFLQFSAPLCKLSKPKITFNYSLLDIFLLLINCETRTEKVYLPKLQAQTNISWSGFKSLELVVKNIPAARPGSKRKPFLALCFFSSFYRGRVLAGCWVLGTPTPHHRATTLKCWNWLQIKTFMFAVKSIYGKEKQETAAAL